MRGRKRQVKKTVRAWSQSLDGLALAARAAAAELDRLGSAHKAVNARWLREQAPERARGGQRG